MGYLKWCQLNMEPTHSCIATWWHGAPALLYWFPRFKSYVFMIMFVINYNRSCSRAHSWHTHWWSRTLCIPVLRKVLLYCCPCGSQLLEGSYCLHVLGQAVQEVLALIVPEDDGSMILQNVGKHPMTQCQMPDDWNPDVRAVCQIILDCIIDYSRLRTRYIEKLQISQNSPWPIMSDNVS